jgi:hypothetical protein
MALQFRKVTEQQRLAFTPVVGEPVYTIDTKRLYLGDGATIGGVNVIENILVQDFVNAELDESELQDGDFLYYSDSENKWKIGKHSLQVSELEDVTSPDSLEIDFILVYQSATSKWLIRERLPKSLDDVEEFSVSSSLSVDSLLEYNATTERFEAKAVPPTPNIEDLLGVEINNTPKRGHIFAYDPGTGDYVNTYINYGGELQHNANLFNFKDLDYVVFNGDSNNFEKKTPFLKDVDLLSLDGLTEPAPIPVVFPITVGADGRFAIGNSSAPPITINRNKIYEFDLSSPALVGKTFGLSLVFDGTHSIDPPGETLTDRRIVIEGIPGIDGVLRLNLMPEGSPYGPPAHEPDGDTSGEFPWEEDEDGDAEIYYFCVEAPEMGNKITIEPAIIKPFVLKWDSSQNQFDIKRFSYSLNNLGNVDIEPDEEGLIFNQQLLAYDAGNNVWTNPGDMVVGVGIGAQLPRTRTKFSSAMWAGGIRGLGSFDLQFEDGEELKDVVVKLSELEMEGADQDFDVFMFDSEEDREEFYEMLEEAARALGPGGALSPQAIEDIADSFSAKGRKIKKSRIKANEKEYTRDGKSTPPTARKAVAEGLPSLGLAGGGLGDFGSMLGNFDLSGLGGLGGGGGGGGTGSDGFKDGLGDEPGLDDFGYGFPSPEEEAEAFKEAYKNFPGNVKKIFGAILARNRALKKLLPDSFGGPGGAGLGGGVEIEYSVQQTASEGLEPLIFGWRQSTDIYGYYYFTYTQRASVLTYNSRHHFMDVQSCMRRCGCLLDKSTTFKVVFYYDADDSTYMAGPWLRIVEWQNPVEPYTGRLEEYPHLPLRKDIEEWNPGTKYRKNTRVIYDNKLWECLIEFSEAQPPGPGSTLAPTTIEGKPVSMFVEIPAFSVKSQVFDGVYQMRCVIGKSISGSSSSGTGTASSNVPGGGGYTHPVFNFGEKGDDADYLYVGANLELVGGGGVSTIPSNQSQYSLSLDTRTGARNNLGLKNLDIGVFMYDSLVHSAIQHLMVQEFQTFNIERRLGECNLAPSTAQTAAERRHALLSGNGSACSQTGESNPLGSVPIGIPSYRGIFRPYGNQGYHIDGLNVDSSTGAAAFSKDFSLHSDAGVQPIGYTFLENLPKPVLSGTGFGAAFISNFYTYRRTDFSDFVFMLPKTLGGGRDSFLGDRIAYRNTPSSPSLLATSVGSPYSGQINQVPGGNGIFNLNLHPPGLSTSVQGVRWCVKRRGKSLTPKTQKVGEKDLGTVTNAEGVVIESNLTQAEAQAKGLLGQPGSAWNYDKTVDVIEVVPGNERSSGEAGTATASLARIESSKSAVCIGVCDETDAVSASFLYGQWNVFREKFPDREHWILVPSEFDPNLTAPPYTSALDYGRSNLALLLAPPTSGSGFATYPTGRVPVYGFGAGDAYLQWSVSSPLTVNNGIIPDNYEIEIFRPVSGTLYNSLANADLIRFAYFWRWNISTSETPNYQTGLLSGGIINVGFVDSQLDNAWTSVAYSPTLDRYVAVSGEFPTWNVMYSSSGGGKNWVIAETPIGTGSSRRGYWKKVIWAPGLNLFVAVATSVVDSNDRIMTSSDGISWTIRSFPIPPGLTSLPSVRDIVYSPELNLLVATAPNSTLQAIITSPDGINWTLRSVPSITNDPALFSLWDSVCWSARDGCFLAAASITYSEYPLLKSTNGIDWIGIQVPNLASQSRLSQIIFSEEQGQYVAVAADYISGSNAFWSSPDGITWTGHGGLGLNYSWEGVAYSPTLDLYVAIARVPAFNCVAYSKNGQDWSNMGIRVPTSRNLWSQIIWVAEDQQFIAVAEYGFGDRVMTSKDGLIWETQRSMAVNETESILSYPTLQWRRRPDRQNPNINTLIGVQEYKGIKPFSPISKNQKTSLPMTYRLNRSSYLAQFLDPLFETDLVWIADIAMANSGEIANLEGRTITIEYKIRIPAGIETRTNSIRIIGGADNQMEVTIRNPINNQQLSLTWEGFSTNSAYYNFSLAQISELLSPTQINDQNEWLEMTVKLLNVSDPSSPKTTWQQNPSAYCLKIDALISGSRIVIFNAREYAEFTHGVYGGFWGSLSSAMNHPVNRSIDAALGAPSYGPYAVTRDNGAPASITDWFDLCNLERFAPGSLVGLFIDRSGSMTQSTIQASYSLFYSRCAAAGLRIVEVQNTREDWVTPFIDEI